MAPKKKVVESEAVAADDVSMGEAPLDDEVLDMDGPIDPLEQRIRIVSFLHKDRMRGIIY